MAPKIKRGDVYYIRSYYTTGSEQKAGRPAIIVSNDKNNAHAGTYEVVYLTTQQKPDLPTHVTIRSLQRESTALCEQVTTVSDERISDYCGRITDTELANINIALLISLELYAGPVQEKVVEVIKEVPVPAPAEPEKSQRGGVEPGEVSAENAKLRIELAEERAKFSMLQTMYESLLCKSMK